MGFCISKESEIRRYNQFKQAFAREAMSELRKSTAKTTVMPPKDVSYKTILAVLYALFCVLLTVNNFEGFNDIDEQ